MHYNGANNYLFVNGTETIKFKAKDSEIVAITLCLENISKEFFVDDMKKTGLYGYIYDFSVDCDDIKYIYNDLMKKNNMTWKCLDLLQKFSVKYIFILCGTNNLDHNPPEELVKRIILSAKKQCHIASVVLIPLHPRGKKDLIRRGNINITKRL